MARVAFRPELIAYLLSQKGEVVFLNDIMAHLPVGASESSVRSTMRRFVNEGQPLVITVLAAGHTWRIGSMARDGSEAPRAQEWAGTMVEAAKPKNRHGNGDFDNRYARGPVQPQVGPFVKLGKMEDGSELVRDEATGQLYTLRAL